MSSRELERLEILGRVAERRLTQRQAAAQLGLGLRQVERLCRALRELHGVAVSLETLRSWMITEGVWIPRARRARRPHPPRQRRSCLGELVQIDSCQHAWFEERGPKCTLLVYVDDSTSRLQELRFAASESVFDSFASTRSYLERHGKPVAFYGDQASIFGVAAPEAVKGTGGTQFGRALSELNIDILCANTPQAKGRRPAMRTCRSSGPTTTSGLHATRRALTRPTGPFATTTILISSSPGRSTAGSRIT